MGMVKRRLYRFLSVVAISAMMATSVVPPSVHATEVDGATEAVEDEESVTEEGADSEEVAEEDAIEEDSKKDDATEGSNGVEDSKEAKSEDAEEDDEKEKSDETCEITYSLEDFNADYGFSGSWGSEVSFKKGVCTLEFSSQYAEKIFGLPEGIKGADVVKATVKVKKGDVSGFTVKLRNQGEELKASYSSNTIENNDGVEFDGFGLMRNGDGGATYKLSGITLTLKGSAEDYPEPTPVSEEEDDDTPTRNGEIEWDIPDLKDYVSSKTGLGDDSYTGAAIMISEITDQTLMDLVEKHFNAVTFGNEFKPDSLFGYNNNKPADGQIITETWTDAKGVTHKDMEVPKMDFSRPEKMLKVLKDWNDEHPDDQIKVRGHVLTWHSQTPAWFFKENYDPNGEFVSPEEMSIRHEWFIKSVFEHVFSSEYKDMFYGWDVVNEACSDGSGTYRSASENSNWARIYGIGSSEDAPEYILNAFRYANYYAHEMGQDSLELYYNDYNECSGNKPDAIAQLLESVKKHEKDSVLPTRITGYGMQGHHNMQGPTKQQIVDCGIRYGKIVGTIQVTELDFKCSSDFDGSEAMLSSEYTKEAYRYKEVLDAYREIDAEPGIDVNGFTIWGVIDPNSWLQTSSSVGGGANGRQKQVPLLFDGQYKAKPAFWALVDPSKLEPAINSITVVQAAGKDPFAHGKQIKIEGTDYSFIPVWDGNKVSVKVKAAGAKSVKLYVDFAQAMADGADVQVAESAFNEDGECVLTLEGPKEFEASAKFALDVVVTDEEGEHAFNNTRLTQAEGSKYFAKALCKPYMSVVKGTPEVDGKVDKVWDNAKDVELTITGGTHPNATASAKVLWDEKNLYVLMNVKDAVLDATASAVHEKDSVEVFIDENNHKADAFEDDDKQYRINYLNETSFNGTKCLEENCEHAVTLTDDGYMVEAAFAWTDITPEVGTAIGLDLQINDGENGGRIGTRTWYDETGNGWSAPRVFGEVTLADAEAEPEEPEESVPTISLVEDAVYTGKAIKPEVVVVVGDKTLVKGIDYKVSYKNNKNAATKVSTGMGDDFDESLPTVIVKLKGEYEGELKANFTISAADFAGDAFEFEAPKNLKEKKSAQAPNVTVKFNGKKLSKSEYTVTYKLGEDGKEMKKLPAKASNGDGQYFAVVRAAGSNFTGEKVVALDVIADAQVHIADVNVKDRVVEWNEKTNRVTLKMSYKVNANDEAAYFGVKKGTTVTLKEGKDYEAEMLTYIGFFDRGLCKVKGNGPFFGYRVVIVRANFK
ncbi:endo-1,4-beta-xylanase [Pseudobutyrivibrio sp. 49]|uniref:endo-1,4-beta-xylanase n=1 Tax=Pseudobutyrivibrio sp. 49 TaxID=1855344 RepID=UPI00089154DC|nr:endo-1,4-beta-xylanase [Pseudobutyrivibrio sp. 49]SDH79955.1 endo-1,4-beta-xylanase [Pseudobutyrivibrio sp. 49]